jgi:hypothetical protein
MDEPYRFNLTADRIMPECGIAIADCASDKNKLNYFSPCKH